MMSLLHHGNGEGMMSLLYHRNGEVWCHYYVIGMGMVHCMKLHILSFETNSSQKPGNKSVG